MTHTEETMFEILVTILGHHGLTLLIEDDERPNVTIIHEDSGEHMCFDDWSGARLFIVGYFLGGNYRR